MQNLLSDSVHSNHRKKLTLSILAGLFLFFVLYFYEGYNIQQGISFSGHGLLARSIAFGLLSTVIFQLMEFLLEPKFSIQPKSLNLWIFRSLEMVVGATATFLLFNYFWEWTEWTLNAYFLMVGEYILVMVLPIAFTEILFRTPSSSSSSSNTEQSKPQPQKAAEYLVFESENAKEKLRIAPTDFFYITSADNYVDIWFDSAGELNHTLLRNSLKEIEQQFEDSIYVQRCHRSYIVNPAKVIKTKTHAKGMKLAFSHNIEIPVSQKYMEEIKSMINKLP